MTQVNSPRRTPNRSQTTPSQDSPTGQTLRVEPEYSQGHETTHNHRHQHQHQQQHQQQHQHQHLNQNQHRQTSVSNDDDVSELTGRFAQAIDLSHPVPRNPLPRCYGFNTNNTPCGRFGNNPVEFNRTNSENNTEIRHYCYQHEPSMSADRKCLAIIKSGKRQCEKTCSLSEIRPVGLPICNTHYGTNAKLVPH